MKYLKGRNVFERMKLAGLVLGAGYLGVGGIFGFVRFVSYLLHSVWALGGALWRDGDVLGMQFIFAALTAVFLSVLGAVLTVFFWPVSLWMSLSTNETFLQWLLFPWLEAGFLTPIGQ